MRTASGGRGLQSVAGLISPQSEQCRVRFVACHSVETLTDYPGRLMCRPPVAGTTAGKPFARMIRHRIRFIDGPWIIIRLKLVCYRLETARSLAEAQTHCVLQAAKNFHVELGQSRNRSSYCSSLNIICAMRRISSFCANDGLPPTCAAGSPSIRRKNRPSPMTRKPLSASQLAGQSVA
jgi:hypothetical protein